MRPYKGVAPTKNGQRWQCWDSKRYVGTFDSKLEAVIARDLARTARKEQEIEQVSVPLDGFQDRLNEAIWKSNIDIQDLCKKTGINRTSLYQYRYYGIQPRARAIAALALALNVSADWLLGLKDDTTDR